MKPTFFKTPADLRAWYEKNHAVQQEFLIGLYKKNSGKPSISYQDSVDEALCFGWIDGVRRSFDADSYTIRFTPRKRKSIWSAVNIKRATELEQAGRMHETGLAAFHGRDEKLTNQYSFENKERTLDAAQEKLFRANKKGWAWFSTQAPYYQRAASWWVISAKQAQTRAKRLETLIQDSAQGQKIAPLRRVKPQK